MISRFFIQYLFDVYINFIVLANVNLDGTLINNFFKPKLHAKNSVLGG